MTETREARASATETKFVLDAARGADVREWARRFLKADPYGAGAFGDEYHTASLYLDTAALDVFHRRGSFGRAKFRIRRYSGADYAFVERKMRRPNLLVKRRMQVGLEVLRDIERGTIPGGAPAWWFQERVRVRKLIPSCLLSYHRTARGVALPAGLARLTVDDGLLVEPASRFRLDGNESGVPVLAGQVILELKYRGVFPAIFQELVRTFHLQRTAASKYRLGMAALGHALPGAPPRPCEGEGVGEACR